MASQAPTAPRVGAHTLTWVSCLALVLSGGLAAWPTAVAAPAQVDTGSIAGHVQIVTRTTRRLHSAGAYPSRTVGASAAASHSELANVVVHVNAPVTRTPPRRAAIRQVDEEFVPHVTVVTAGSTVEFPNEDFVFHNVFSLSRAGTFDLGRFPQGQSRSRTFRQSGTVKVYCHLHSHMSAVIRVFDHPFFAVPNADGLFTIDGLPPGRYQVVAWHERVGEVTLRTEVVAGRTAQLAFSLPLTDEP